MIGIRLIISRLLQLIQGKLLIPLMAYFIMKTDLDIEEHFTDTNGYSDQVFGMTALLGFDFEPRIRNIKKSQLFFYQITFLLP
jgi:TnpA family transposase